MRVLHAVALVFLLIASVPHTLGQAGAAGEASRDRGQLIDGVREIAAPGSPGSLVVYAPTASVVVTGGSDGGSDVAVVACGRLGKGRVVALAHDGFFASDNLQIADTSRLMANAVSWAAADRQKPRVGLIDGHPLQSLLEQKGAIVGRVTLDQGIQGVDVLVINPWKLSPQQVQRLRAFVRSGGGLVVAATGWGWQQFAKKPMSEFPGNWLLAGSGVAWTEGFANKTGPKGFTTGGEVSPYVNTATALELLKAHRDAGPKDLACALASIRLALQVVPAAEPQLRSDIRKMLDGMKADLVPTRQKPVRIDDPSRRFAVGLETVLMQQSPVEELAASPAAKDFPGPVPADAPRGEHKVTINTAVPGWQSLGLYAAPGEKITVTVPRGAIGLNLAVQVGSHTDQLWNLDAWERLPQVVRRFPVTKTTTTAANALGGLVYIDVSDGTKPGKIAVTIKNVVEAPLYRLGTTTREEWQSRQRNRPAPWAEFVGKNVVFTFPSSFVRELDDPKGVITLWDEVIAAQDSFASSTPRKRPERVVADVQISAGYMHSGYPIMIPIDDSVPLGLSESRLRKEGAWGYFHEFGHNHQSGDWTFDGTGEVTNNLIVLYIFDKVLGQRFDSGHENIRDRDQRNRRIREFMAKGAPFDEWKKDPFLALMMYIQLYEAFGPEPFKVVFAEYARLAEGERPKSDDEKRDQWLVRLSKATGKNLGPFFRAWGVPTSDGARVSVSKLPSWMPPGFQAPK
jgi:hypothetical protein